MRPFEARLKSLGVRRCLTAALAVGFQRDEAAPFSFLLSTVSGPARCHGGRQTRDRHLLAPCGVQSLLALGIEAATGKTDGAA